MNHAPCVHDGLCFLQPFELVSSRRGILWRIPLDSIRRSANVEDLTQLSREIHRAQEELRLRHDPLFHGYLGLESAYMRLILASNTPIIDTDSLFSHIILLGLLQGVHPSALVGPPRRGRPILGITLVSRVFERTPDVHWLLRNSH